MCPSLTSASDTSKPIHFCHVPHQLSLNTQPQPQPHTTYLPYLVPRNHHDRQGEPPLLALLHPVKPLMLLLDHQPQHCSRRHARSVKCAGFASARLSVPQTLNGVTPRDLPVRDPARPGCHQDHSRVLQLSTPAAPRSSRTSTHLSRPPSREHRCHGASRAGLELHPWNGMAGCSLRPSQAQKEYRATRNPFRAIGFQHESNREGLRVVGSCSWCQREDERQLRERLSWYSNSAAGTESERERE